MVVTKDGFIIKVHTHTHTHTHTHIYLEYKMSKSGDKKKKEREKNLHLVCVPRQFICFEVVSHCNLTVDRVDGKEVVRWIGSFCHVSKVTLQAPVKKFKPNTSLQWASFSKSAF